MTNENLVLGLTVGRSLEDQVRMIDTSLDLGEDYHAVGFSLAKSL